MRIQFIGEIPVDLANLKIMKLLLFRIKNELYYWLYFKWVRLVFPYLEPNRAEFNKYHIKYWELHSKNNDSDWRNRLFDYDEVFISPCSWNEINCGWYGNGKYLLQMRFIGGMIVN